MCITSKIENAKVFKYRDIINYMNITSSLEDIFRDFGGVLFGFLLLGNLYRLHSGIKTCSKYAVYVILTLLLLGIGTVLFNISLQLPPIELLIGSMLLIYSVGVLTVTPNRNDTDMIGPRVYGSPFSINPSVENRWENRWERTFYNSILTAVSGVAILFIIELFSNRLLIFFLISICVLIGLWGHNHMSNLLKDDIIHSYFEVDLQLYDFFHRIPFITLFVVGIIYNSLLIGFSFVYLAIYMNVYLYKRYHYGAKGQDRFKSKYKTSTKGVPEQLAVRYGVSEGKKVQELSKQSRKLISLLNQYDDINIDLPKTSRRSTIKIQSKELPDEYVNTVIKQLCSREAVQTNLDSGRFEKELKQTSNVENLSKEAQLINLLAILREIQVRQNTTTVTSGKKATPFGY